MKNNMAKPLETIPSTNLIQCTGGMGFNQEFVVDVVAAPQFLLSFGIWMDDTTSDLSSGLVHSRRGR